MRTKVFISYSHDDARWLSKLREQLAVLEGERLVDLFDDTRIGAGDDWFARLQAELARARIALLLVSASFLNSDFIRREEVPRLLADQQRSGLLLIPLLLRDCAWQELPWLARLQLRPRDAQPLARLKGPALDRVLADLAREVALLARHAPAAAADPTLTPTVTPAHGWDTTVRFPTTRPDWDIDSLRRAEHELARFLGPMARVMVRHACGTSKNLAALHRALAQHIPQAADRDAFLAAVAPPTAVTATSALDEALVEHARSVLARQIGPIAGVLVKRFAADAATPASFFERLAEQVDAGPERERLLAELQTKKKPPA